MALSNSQHQQIMRDYENRRISNYQLHTRRKLEVYKNIPEIQTLDHEIAENAVHLGKLLLQRDDPQASVRCREQNRHLLERKHLLLKDAGYSENYLDPVYTCNDCRDTGYIGNEKCHCFKQEIINLIYSSSNMNQVLQKDNFTNFNENYYSDKPIYKDLPSPRQNILSVLEICRDFIGTFPTAKNLLFQGSTGVGKTFLSHCLAKEIMDRGYTCVYVTAFQLFDILAAHVFHKQNSSDEQLMSFDLILNSDLVIIDDLGTEINNQFVISQLFNCLNERLLREKSTIISTNLSLKDLQKNYSERVMSRISESYTICKIYGEDIRLKKSFQTYP